MSYLYKIKNHKTNRVYIGSTVNFEGRKDSHISQLKSKTHHSYKLQKDWNKYDETDFSFYIVKDLGRVSFDELHKAEETLISKQKNPYNVHLTPFSKPYKTPVKRRKKSNKKKRKVHKQLYNQSPYLPTHSDKVKYHLDELKKLGINIKIVATADCK
jgi:group I intron endonuclease